MLIAGTFRAFRHRDYFIFWCGLLLGYTGTLIQTTAQSWLIFQLTNSPFTWDWKGYVWACRGYFFRPSVARSSTAPTAKSFSSSLKAHSC